jgi:PqqD family protein of HPr-rel-A system
MVLLPADTSPQTAWQICRQRAGIWRDWDGEVVVYDDLSGDTMKLDAVVSEVFRLLLQGPLTMGQVIDHLVTAFEMAAGADVPNLAATALNRLKEAGLVTPLADGDAPGHRS